MATPWEISGDHIEEWAERVQSAARLPLLVRRLLTTTLPLDAIEMRGDGGVRLPGWDGEVRAQQGNLWCPAGLSFWELSVQSTSAKLDRDFQKRTNVAGPACRTATYVAVLAKRFAKKQQWLDKARARGAWSDVRLFDADDLAIWLEQSPAASLWMADELGRPVKDIATLDALLHTWSQKTSPAVKRQEELTPCRR